MVTASWPDVSGQSRDAGALVAGDLGILRRPGPHPQANEPFRSTASSAILGLGTYSRSSNVDRGQSVISRIVRSWLVPSATVNA
jgi:hypothetical protein